MKPLLTTLLINAKGGISMRKYVLALILFTFLTACSNNNISPDSSNAKDTTGTTSTQPSASKTDTPEIRVSDYFAFTKDVHMKYKGTGNEYAQFETYIDYLKDNTVQVRNLNGGTITVNIYKLTEGAIKRTFTQGETYFKYDYTSSSNKDEIIIMKPIKEGTSWTLNDGATRAITSVDKQIKTPAGDFNALEITTKRVTSTIRDYYVKNVGLVKSEFTSGNSTDVIISELQKIEKGVPYKHNVRFYFPEFSKNRIVFIDRDVEIYTNEDIKFKFQKELKTIPEYSGLAKVLSTNTSVLGSIIDDKKGWVTVNFSTQLVQEMNAGTSLESMLLKSITNTFGDYYQKDKVIITIKGKPYESGHILMKPGEYFTVEKENQVRYEKP